MPTTAMGDADWGWDLVLSSWPLLVCRLLLSYDDASLKPLFMFIVMMMSEIVPCNTGELENEPHEKMTSKKHWKHEEI